MWEVRTRDRDEGCEAPLDGIDECKAQSHRR